MGKIWPPVPPPAKSIFIPLVTGRVRDLQIITYYNRIIFASHNHILVSRERPRSLTGFMFLQYTQILAPPQLDIFLLSFFPRHLADHLFWGMMSLETAIAATRYLSTKHLVILAYAEIKRCFMSAMLCGVSGDVKQNSHRNQL